MNVHDAAYRTVHDFPGGSEALGPLVGKSPAVLRSKVNPNIDTHTLTVDDLRALIRTTGDKGMLHALAAEFDCTVQEGEASANDAPLPLQMMGVTVEHGHLAQCVSKAVEDGRICPNERREIQRCGLIVVSAVNRVIASISAQVGRVH